MRRLGKARPELAPRSKYFEARFAAEDPNHVLIAKAGLTFSVAQKIRKDGVEEMWDSVVIRCSEEDDGVLAVRVFVRNPDWDGTLQIACLRSAPSDSEGLTPLGCNLDHEQVEPEQ
jgi:hypothetical protein